MPPTNAHLLPEYRCDPRLTPRVRIQTTGIITAASPTGSPTHGARVLDLSLGGARLLSRQSCIPGQEFSVILRFRPRLLRLDAVAVWVKPRNNGMYECGVAVQRISPKARAFLSEILANRLRPQLAANCAFYPARPANSSGPSK